MRSGRTQRTATPTGCWSDRPFVDEASSALVSIAHRPAMAAFHDQQWTLVHNAGGGSRFRLEAS